MAHLYRLLICVICMRLVMMMSGGEAWLYAAVAMLCGLEEALIALRELRAFLRA